ncbi:hypothetical protein [Bradyrhizobium sp. STM 3562]|uniref:hypothetical protein n=1 Tax=Bradyrhizobium sp. STM 3562 TaxID=578924 RepID=UPI00388F41EB
MAAGDRSSWAAPERVNGATMKDMQAHLGQSKDLLNVSTFEAKSKIILEASKAAFEKHENKIEEYIAGLEEVFED